jgi:hypothetical protein
MQEWQKNYIYSLINNDNDNLFKLKEKYLPLKLYRFRPCNEKSLKNLLSSQLYLTSPKTFNDPYDAKPLFDKEKFWEISIQNKKIKSYIKNITGSSDNPTEEDLLEYKKFVKRIQSALILFMNDFRIACFSENNYSDILMWSHYADCHKGICLEYDVKKEILKKQLLNFIHPVIYSNEIYDLSEYMCCLIEQFVKKRKSINYNQLFPSVLYKAKSWEYEREWRLILTEDNKSDKLIDIDKPSAIYMGLNIENKYRKLIIAFANDNEIPVYEMFQKGNEYKLLKKDCRKSFILK